MSLEKAIHNGKEKRKQYYDSRRFDWSCKNHGSCAYCRNNRTFKHKKNSIQKNKTEQVNEYFGYWHLPDPSDGEQAHWESVYRRMGIDPNDWDTLVELGELYKG